MIGWPALNGVGQKPELLTTGQGREKLQARVSGDSFQNGTVLGKETPSPTSLSSVGKMRK